MVGSLFCIYSDDADHFSDRYGTLQVPRKADSVPVSLLLHGQHWVLGTSDTRA